MNIDQARGEIRKAEKQQDALEGAMVAAEHEPAPGGLMAGSPMGPTVRVDVERLGIGTLERHAYDQGTRHVLQLRAIEKAHARMARRENMHREQLAHVAHVLAGVGDGDLLAAKAARRLLKELESIRQDHYPPRAQAKVEL